MTVKVTKRSVNFLEKLNELDKQSGVAGEAILRSNSFTEASNLVGGRKNLVINGSFDISQRGDFTDLTPISNQEFTVDRFQHIIGNITASVEHSSSNVNNITCKTLRMQSTSTAASGYFGIRTNLELGGIVIGQMYTVSCWIKTNRSDVVIRVNDFDNADENSSQIHSGGEKWEHITMTVPFTGNSPNPLVRIWFGITYANASSTINDGDYIEIAMPQLEAGSTATAFEHRTYGEELALCQRYYWQSHSGPQGSPTGTAVISSTGVQGQTSTGMINGCVILPVEMRTNGTVSFYDWAGTPGVMMRFDPNSANHYGETGYVAVRHNRWLFINSTNGTAASQVGAHVEIDAEL